MEVILASSTTQLFRWMVSGRVDAIVVPGLTSIASLRTQEFQGVHRLTPSLFSHDVYHYLHRKNRDLVPAITDVLRRMRSEGRIRQIREDYIKELSCP
jgi:ABC-type amino acid transport substrate-binding protein